MADKHTVNDMAVDAMVEFQKTKEAAHDYNDFGSFVGFREEMDDIQQSLEHALNCSISRCFRLRDRIQKFKEGKRQVETLSRRSS